jgi:hypothetical protein
MIRCALAAGGLLLFASLAAAQETTPVPPANPPAPARQYNPGMLDSVSRWFTDSFKRLATNAEGTRTPGDQGERATGATTDAAKSTADAAKSAADAVARLPNTRVVAGRVRCAATANGTPDCRKAAETVCKGKGFGSGSSLDIQSTQKCPARVWLSGRQPDPGECQAEAFVVRAVCQ